MAEVELTRPPWRGEDPLEPDSNQSSNFSNNGSTDLNVGNAKADNTAYPTEARERQKVAEKVAEFAGVE
eukprot:4113800-Lingulodinium_polyedra.AAC.1